MNSLQESFILHNGIKIPCVGFGTYLSAAGGESAESRISAYRHGGVLQKRERRRKRGEKERHRARGNFRDYEMLERRPRL